MSKDIPEIDDLPRGINCNSQDSVSYTHLKILIPVSITVRE